MRDTSQLTGSFSKRHAVTREFAFAFPIVLRLIIGLRFQVLFTSLTGMLFIGSSRYLFTIGRQLVLSLGRWSSQIHAGFHVSGATWGNICSGRQPFPYRAFTFSGRAFQTRSGKLSFGAVDGPATPETPESASGLGYSHFARRY